MEYVGFDCETIKGKCRLIGLSTGEHIKVRTEKDVVSFLDRFKGEYNLVAFNADYDIQSLITYFPLEIKKRLLYGILTTIKNGKIVLSLTYIPHKYARFGNTYIFDVQQFYNSSLDVASKKYLGKFKGNVDASKITERNIYSDKVIKYCIKDAQLAKELLDHFIKDLPDTLKDVKPISPAFYSGSYFSKELGTNEPPAQVNNQFRKAYHGGRFEVFKRGYFKKAYYYDINSAYPFEISQLLTLNGATFAINKEYDPDASYSVYLIQCDIKDSFVGPLVYKQKMLSYYPIGDFKGYVTKGELERVMEYDPEILGAMHIYCPNERPFEKKIVPMYIKKQESQFSLVYKTLLNSLYGRTAMSIKKWKKGIMNEDVYGVFTDPNSGEIFYKIEDSFSSNFVYASEITARTRLRMFDVVKKYGNRIIAVQTDGIISEVPLELPLSLNMGDWKKEIWSDLYVIGSGVYFYKNEGKLEGHFRGFACSEEKTELILSTILKAKTNKVEFKTKKHYSIAESMRLHDEEKENVIMDVIRNLDLNFDRKRTWNGSWKNGRDVQNKIISSMGLINIILDKEKDIL